MLGTLILNNSNTQNIITGNFLVSVLFLYLDIRLYIFTSFLFRYARPVSETYTSCKRGGGGGDFAGTEILCYRADGFVKVYY